MDTSSYSLADLSAAMGNGSSNFNNPMWLIWALLFGFGGNGFGRQGAAQGTQDAEIMSQLNAIRTQMSDNQATASLGTAIASNHDYLHDLSNGMNLGFAGTQAGISNASMTNLLGQKDAQAQMASCCCDIKSNILNQTNQLQSRIDQLANGVQTAAASLGYAMAQQTNELNTNASANTQRIIDYMNAATTQELRDKLLEASQTAQTATIISSLKTTTTA